MNDSYIRTLIDEAVARAVQKVRVPTLRPGTVAAVTSPPRVLVDGDTEPIEVPSLIGSVTLSQRVMIIFYPPSGVAIIGHIT